ncbi:FAD dependent oxidoreductase [Lipomyces arxii]|uniref:FAD dependent oxidoreductase n=1 Tax=Lipomyces arxii TaxID=56418 RepID=UPI0034CE3F0F
MPSSFGLMPSASKMSTWLDPPSMLSTFRTTSTLPATADIVIIGSGFSGASVAYHALKAYSGINIVMLEAGDICQGASGRNGGHLRPDLFSYASTLASKYGPEEAVKHNQFERANYDAVRKLAEEEGIECEISTDSEAWQVFLTEEEFKTALSELGLMRNFGGDVHDVRVYMQDEARKITGIRACVGAISSPGTSISPSKLVTSLLEQSLFCGLNLQTHTKVLSVSRHSTNNGVFSSDVCSTCDSETEDFEHVDFASLRISPKKSSYLHRVTTTRGSILANKVVHATNAYLDTLLSFSSDVQDTRKTPGSTVLVSPVRGHVIEIASTLKEGRRLSLDPNHKITNMTFNRGGEYLIQRPNGNFVLGGCRRFGQEQGVESFFSTTTEETEIDTAVDLSLRSFFTQTLCYDSAHYLQPPRTVFGESAHNTHYSSEYKIVKQWTGIMGFSVDDFSLVGKVPSFFLEESQEYCIAGFTGHGMARIFLAAKALVNMILQEDEEYQFDCQYHSLAGSVSECDFSGQTDVADVILPESFKITEERLATMISLSHAKEKKLRE